MACCSASNYWADSFRCGLPIRILVGGLFVLPNVSPWDRARAMGTSEKKVIDVSLMITRTYGGKACPAPPLKGGCSKKYIIKQWFLARYLLCANVSSFWFLVISYYACIVALGQFDNRLYQFDNTFQAMPKPMPKHKNLFMFWNPLFYRLIINNFILFPQ